MYRVHYQLLLGVDHIYFMMLMTLHYAARRSAHYTRKILQPYVDRGMRCFRFFNDGTATAQALSSGDSQRQSLKSFTTDAMNQRGNLKGLTCIGHWWEKTSFVAFGWANSFPNLNAPGDPSASVTLWQVVSDREGRLPAGWSRDTSE